MRSVRLLFSPTPLPGSPSYLQFPACLVSAGDGFLGGDFRAFSPWAAFSLPGCPRLGAVLEHLLWRGCRGEGDVGEKGTNRIHHTCLKSSQFSLQTRLFLPANPVHVGSCSQVRWMGSVSRDLAGVQVPPRPIPAGKQRGSPSFVSGSCPSSS